jgi:hypothetical protein
MQTLYDIINERRLSSIATISIPRRHTQGEAPLSFSQERFWFLSQYEPEAVAFVRAAH